MQPNSFDVIRIPTNGPGDVSGLMALIDGGALPGRTAASK